MGTRGHRTLERAWSRPGQRIPGLQGEAEVEFVTRAWASQTAEGRREGPVRARKRQRKEGREGRGGRRLQVGLGPLLSTHLCSATRHLDMKAGYRNDREERRSSRLADVITKMCI